MAWFHNRQVRSEADINAEVAADAARQQRAARVIDGVVQGFRDSHDLFVQQQSNFQASMAEADRQRTEEYEAKQRAQRDAEAQRQRDISSRHNALCERVIELRARVARAQTTLDGGDPAAAALAVGEEAIAERQLVFAQEALLRHASEANPGRRLVNLSPAQVVEQLVREHVANTHG